MAFELFEGRNTHLLGLSMSAGKSGFYLSRELARLIEKKKWTQVLLFYDDKEKRVGFWMLTAKADASRASRAFKIHLSPKRNYDARISAGSFVTRYNISGRNSALEVKTDLQESPAGDFLYIQLPNGKSEPE